MLWASGGRVRWRTIKTVLEAGYSDAYRTCHPDEPGYTMPTWDPHVRLDYAFVPSSSAGSIISCEVVHHPEATAASDHLPVIAEFEI
jgi:exodeoxyribonuclease-3